VSEKPLGASQRQAADLLGAGWEQKQVASKLGISTSTVRRWLKREDFAARVLRGREAAMSENPSAKATLEAALNATKSNGDPDWRTRVSAARALIGADGPIEPDQQERPTVFHDEHLDPEGD
jgi:transposase